MGLGGADDGVRICRSSVIAAVPSAATASVPGGVGSGPYVKPAAAVVAAPAASTPITAIAAAVRRRALVAGFLVRFMSPSTPVPPARFTKAQREVHREVQRDR
jgi:hypothetical protein